MQKIEVPEVLNKEEYLTLPPYERDLYVRQIIRKTLGMNLHGVSIGMLTAGLPFDFRTIEKHLSILTHTNEIYFVRIGPTILYLPNSRAVRPAIEETLRTDGREYGFYLLQNRLGEFVFIQEKRKTESTREKFGGEPISEEAKGGVLIPIEAFDDFLKHINKFNEKYKTMKAGEN